MARALDIAKYFLDLAGNEPDEAEPMTNLRVQKLAYYVQGWSLAVRSEPMFDDHIEAWKEGPVVPNLYSELKRFGKNPITNDAFNHAKPLSAEDRAFVRSIWEGYKGFSAIGLRNKTHKEQPWKDTYEPVIAGFCNREISHDVMKMFFEDIQGREHLPGMGVDRFKLAEQQFERGEVFTFEEVFAGI